MPYGDSPLGEGSGRDPDPTFRLDRFDCVSFVETVLALGRARSVVEATALLDDVRYGGPPSYRSRNHYVESQWLPSLAGKRWLEDVTPAVGGDDAVQVTVRHGLADWLAAARNGRLLAGLDPKGDAVGGVEARPRADRKGPVGRVEDPARVRPDRGPGGAAG